MGAEVTHEQVCLELLNLDDVLLDERALGHPLVDLWPVHDARRPGRVAERRLGLFKVGPGG